MKLAIVFKWGCLLLFGLSIVVQAAVPKAQIVPPNARKRSSIPIAELKAKKDTQKFIAPEKPWKVPPKAVNLKGQGISVYYLVPVARVAALLPEGLEPYPGPDQIYFRIDFIKWIKISAIVDGKEKTIKPFLELDYRFEVIKNGRRGTYPIKMHMSKKWAALWARKHGNYPAFGIDVAHVNFSPAIHFFQFRQGKFATANVEALSARGIGSGMNDLFNRRNHTLLWQGDGLDFIYSRKTKTLEPISRNLKAELKSGQIESLFLKEPEKWQILGEEEIYSPEKVLILESIQGNWFEEN